MKDIVVLVSTTSVYIEQRHWLQLVTSTSTSFMINEFDYYYFFNQSCKFLVNDTLGKSCMTGVNFFGGTESTATSATTRARTFGEVLY